MRDHDPYTHQSCTLRSCELKQLIWTFQQKCTTICSLKILKLRCSGNSEKRQKLQTRVVNLEQHDDPHIWKLFMASYDWRLHIHLPCDLSVNIINILVLVPGAAAIAYRNKHDSRSIALFMPTTDFIDSFDCKCLWKHMCVLWF